MVFDWVEWLGYLASVVVLISLAMASIVRLRWINLLGCLLFVTYGWLLSIWPVMAVNLGIAAINCWFLYQHYYRGEAFELVPAEPGTPYFEHFLAANRQAIERRTGLDGIAEGHIAFWLLRDNSIAGLVVARDAGDGVLEILLDYVIPKYRDFKLGRFFYQAQRQTLLAAGYTRLLTYAPAADAEHRRYFRAMGFRPSQADSREWFKSL